MSDGITEVNEEINFEEEQPETPIEETPEGGEVAEEIEDIFNPDELEFEETHTLEGYDLSKYKDVLDIENKEVQAKAKKFKDLGFTQEQIEFFIDDTISSPEADREPTAQEVKERLNKSLTPQEKRNYKAVSSFVKTGLDGTDLEPFAVEAMKNPTLVKMFNALYSKTQNNGVKPNTPVTKREVNSKSTMTPTQVREKYSVWLKTEKDITPEKRRSFIKQTIDNTTNSEELTKVFRSLLED